MKKQTKKFSRQATLAAALFGLSFFLPTTPTKTPTNYLSSSAFAYSQPLLNPPSVAPTEAPAPILIVSASPTITPTKITIKKSSSGPRRTLWNVYPSHLSLQPNTVRGVPPGHIGGVSALANSSKISIPKNSSLDPLFTRYAAKFKVDENLLKRIAYCESRLNPHAVGGPYAGLFQFSTSTWIKDRIRHGWDPNPELRFNSQEAIKTAAAKVAGGGINAWPNCR